MGPCSQDGYNVNILSCNSNNAMRVTLNGSATSRTGVQATKITLRAKTGTTMLVHHDIGFKQSYYDSSLFTLQQGGIQINVLLYVDDLIISGNDHDAIHQFKTYLCDCLHMREF